MAISALSSTTTLDTSLITQTAQKQATAPKPSGAGGAPPAGGGNKSSGATSSSSSATDNSKIYDKRDTNKDGTVSSEEAMAYALKHPGEADSSETTAQGYTQQGKTASTSGSASTFSLSV